MGICWGFVLPFLSRIIFMTKHLFIPWVKYHYYNIKISASFTAKYNNLSVITMSLWYYKMHPLPRRRIKSCTDVLFVLWKDNKTPVFESKRFAYDVEGEPNFPFDFLPLRILLINSMLQNLSLCTAPKKICLSSTHYPVVLSLNIPTRSMKFSISPTYFFGIGLYI